MFKEFGMVDASGSGVLYDSVGMFAYLWGWTDEYILSMPLRRRRKYEKVLGWQMKKLFPKNSGGMGQPGKMN